MTSLIKGRLSVGNWQEGHDAKRRGEFVITAASDAPWVGDKQFNLVDGPGNDVPVFWDAVDAVVEAVEKSGKPVFVHCVTGRSRSVAVCVAAYRKLHRIELCEAYDAVIAKHDRSRIHPYVAKLLTDVG